MLKKAAQLLLKIKKADAKERDQIGACFALCMLVGIIAGCLQAIEMKEQADHLRIREELEKAETYEDICLEGIAKGRAGRLECEIVEEYLEEYEKHCNRLIKCRQDIQVLKHLNTSSSDAMYLNVMGRNAIAFNELKYMVNYQRTYIEKVLDRKMQTEEGEINQKQVEMWCETLDALGYKDKVYKEMQEIYFCNVEGLKEISDKVER